MNKFEDDSLEPLNQMLNGGACDVEVKLYIDEAPFVSLSARDNKLLLQLYENVRNCCPRCYEAFRSLEKVNIEVEEMKFRLNSQQQLIEGMSSKDAELAFANEEISKCTTELSRSAEQSSSSQTNTVILELCTEFVREQQKFESNIAEEIERATKLSLQCRSIDSDMDAIKRSILSVRNNRQTTFDLNQQIERRDQMTDEIAELKQENSKILTENELLRREIKLIEEQLSEALLGSETLTHSKHQEVADLRVHCSEVLEKSRAKSQTIDSLEAKIRFLESKLVESRCNPAPTEPRPELVIVEPRKSSEVAILQRAQLLKIELSSVKKLIRGLREEAQKANVVPIENLARDILAVVVSYCMHK